MCSATLNTAGQWAHVAAGYDSAERRIRVWVDGVETSTALSAPNTNTNPIVIGRGQDAGTSGPVEQFRGNVADVQIFDRVLVTDDFTGRLAVRTDDGEVDEPGILDAVEVGRWKFTNGLNCTNDANPRLCNTPADDSSKRQLRTTTGTEFRDGRDGRSLFLDATLADGVTPSPGPSTASRSATTGQVRTGLGVWASAAHRSVVHRVGLGQSRGSR